MSAGERRGFTLLEAVVAMAILSVTGVAALSAVAAELRTTTRAGAALEASALARDRLARLEILRGRDLAVLPDSLRAGTFAPPFERYRWSAAAREVPGLDGLYDVEVEVAWATGGRALATRVYRPRTGGRR